MSSSSTIINPHTFIADLDTVGPMKVIKFISETKIKCYIHEFMRSKINIDNLYLLFLYYKFVLTFYRPSLGYATVDYEDDFSFGRNYEVEIINVNSEQDILDQLSKSLPIQKKFNSVIFSFPTYSINNGYRTEEYKKLYLFEDRPTNSRNEFIKQQLVPYVHPGVDKLIADYLLPEKGNEFNKVTKFSYLDNAVGFFVNYYTAGKMFSHLRNMIIGYILEGTLESGGLFTIENKDTKIMGYYEMENNIRNQLTNINFIRGKITSLTLFTTGGGTFVLPPNTPKTDKN